jgi:hypothetical protein
MMFVLTELNACRGGLFVILCVVGAGHTCMVSHIPKGSIALERYFNKKNKKITTTIFEVIFFTRDDLMWNNFKIDFLLYLKKITFQ